jgi:hypothetical protein
MKTPTYFKGQRVPGVRYYVALRLPELAGRAGTVTAVDGRWVEVAWDGLGIRLGMRPSHLKRPTAPRDVTP